MACSIRRPGGLESICEICEMVMGTFRDMWKWSNQSRLIFAPVQSSPSSVSEYSAKNSVLLWPWISFHDQPSTNPGGLGLSVRHFSVASSIPGCAKESTSKQLKKTRVRKGRRAWAMALRPWNVAGSGDCVVNNPTQSPRKSVDHHKYTSVKSCPILVSMREVAQVRTDLRKIAGFIYLFIYLFIYCMISANKSLRLTTSCNYYFLLYMRSILFLGSSPSSPCSYCLEISYYFCNSCLLRLNKPLFMYNNLQ